MTTITDVITQRDAAISIIVQQIMRANDLKNGGAQGMDDKINVLEHQKTTVAAQAYQAALDDPSMTQALAALRDVTQDMNSVSTNMITAAAFMSNFGSFVSVANKIIPILQGRG